MSSALRPPAPMECWSGPRCPPSRIQPRRCARCRGCCDMAVEVKICGLTRAEDAGAAATAGASYLGVVFVGGPRMVDPSRAAAIVAAAGRSPVLGVFAAQPVDAILRIRDACGLTGAQLHGEYTADDARSLHQEGLLVWRVVRVRGSDDLARLAVAAEAADA